jgi:hypothetical protein
VAIQVDTGDMNPTSRARTYRFPLIAIALAFLIAAGTSSGIAHAAGAQSAPADHKKLIEFGWDVPLSQWLVQHLNEHQDLPFDGMAFSPTRDRLKLFEPTGWTKPDLKTWALSRIEWGRYTDNFILVWATGPTEMDWTDQARWDTVISKTRLLSQAVVSAGAKGVMLDPENYFAGLHPWAYAASRYPGLSFEQVEAIVRRRGAEFMTALASQAPDVEVLSPLSISYVASLAGMDRSLLSSVDTALLCAFTEGMLSAGRGTVIDGDELAYFVDETTEFPERRAMFDHAKEFIAPNVPSDADLRFAQPIYVDLTLGIARYHRGYSPEYGLAWFEHNVYQALLGANEYAWLYSEQLDWWRDWNVPAGALDALRSATTKVESGEALGFDMVASDSPEGVPARFVSTPSVRMEWERSVGQSDPTTLSVTVDEATQVTFYAGSRRLGTDTSAPFELDVSGLTGSLHSLVARAFASDGSHTTSNILAMPIGA